MLREVGNVCVESYQFEWCLRVEENCAVEK